MDYESQKLPLIETIQLFGFSKNAAELNVMNIKSRDPEMAEKIGDPIKMNGIGHSRLCVDLQTMYLILYELPSTQRIRAFQRKCAKDIVRQMKGGQAILHEIRHNRSVLQQTGAIHL